MIELRGKEVAAAIRAQIEKDVAAMGGHIPKLAIVRAGEEEDDMAYERGALKRMAGLGLEAESYAFPKDISNEEFQAELKKINDDPAVNGILLLAPLPKGLDEAAATAIISPEKDIDGIGPVNKMKLYEGDTSGFAPCTAQAVMEVLDYADVDVTGKHITVVGYGMTVGKPLSIMLLNRKATVSICRSRTTEEDLKKLCSASDIIVAATGKMGMIGPDYIKEGAVVIDVGISMGEDGAIHGDVQFAEIAEIAAMATPVPGGVGAVTTTILAKQLVRAAKIQRA
jgi:methylenetetrahydrofolate dehydrogenase (NADP+)/methenyltetrahydrofolate cyclohydrolase